MQKTNFKKSKNTVMLRRTNLALANVEISYENLQENMEHCNEDESLLTAFENFQLVEEVKEC